jgi:nicotinamidase/pyrazinamidase
VPDPVRYDKTTALLVVDVQNDFADPGGGLYVVGGEEVVPVINAEIGRARDAGAFVCYTQDWHPAHTPHFAQDGGIWPVHCVGGTWGAEFHPDLMIVGPSVQKGSNGEDGYSGFTMRDPESGTTIPTELASMLQARAIRRVVVVGLALDYCVKDTTLDGLREGFDTMVLLSATRPVDLNAGDGEIARVELAEAGATVL